MKRVAPASAKSYVVGGIAVPAPDLPAGLYVTATPIGNLADVTLRALATLAAADLIACEDTRVTSRLTRHYGIATPLTPYHEHNAAKAGEKLLAAMADGQAVALVTDAGTPLVSDPGARLIADAIAAGHAVVPIPGPSAVLAGLTAAGLPTDSFHFAGFLPPRSAARKARLAGLAAIPSTLVFYESPRRIADTLADAAAVLGADRRAVVAREVTKVFETFRRGTIADLAAAFAAEETPKGEVTFLIGPPLDTAPEADAVDAALRRHLATASVGEAAAAVAAATGLPRRVLYARALQLRDRPDGDG